MGQAIEGGGGIFSGSGTVTLTKSTISNNKVTGSGIGSGGGIFTSGTLALTSSTVSGNASSVGGGGIFNLGGAVTLTNSTVSGNVSAVGGGIYVLDSSFDRPIIVEKSIVAGNTDNGTAPDLKSDADGPLTINHSLIGVADGLTILGNVGNQTGTGGSPLNPLLGPLVDNGGPTQTHMPLTGSPAIDAGDPNFAVPPSYDQRGFAFDRVVGGRIDIGAIESGATSADFDSDGDIDGSDFLHWQRGFDSPSHAHSNGDANLDGNVDASDRTLLLSNYGQATTVASGGLQAVGRNELIDAVMARALLDTDDATIAEFVLDSELSAVTFASKDEVKELAPSGSNTQLTEISESTSQKSESGAEPWLADELIERVFG